MSKTKHRLAGPIKKELVEVAGRDDWHIPTHWHWHELSNLITTSETEIGDAVLRVRDTSAEGTITTIFSEDLKNSKEIYTFNKVTEEKRKEKNLTIFTGRKLLVAAARETAGRVGILAKGQTAICNNVVSVITPNEEVILLDFLYYYFRLEQTRHYLQKIHAPGRSYLSPNKMGKVKVPVPPLKEQQHIVERIETLTLDIRRCREQVQHSGIDALTALYQAITTIFAPLRIKRWTSYILLQEVLDRDTPSLRQNTSLSASAQYPHITATAIEPLTGRLLLSIPLKQDDLVAPVILYYKERRDRKQTEQQNSSAKQDALHERFASFPLVIMVQQAQITYHQSFLELMPKLQTEVLPRFLYWSLLADVVTLDGIPLSEGAVSEKTIGIARLRFPGKDEQEQIVRQLDALQTQIIAIRKKQDRQLKYLEEIAQLIFERALQGKL